MKIEKINNQIEWVNRLLDVVKENWQQAILNNGIALIGLAGGKTPFELYYKMGLIGQELIQKTKFFLVDERKVSWKNTQSNHFLIENSLAKGLSEMGIKESLIWKQIGDFGGKGENIQVLKVYEQWIGKNIVKRPDLTILGVGKDGHFASVFPDFAHWDDLEDLSFSTQTEEFEVKDRFTLNPHFIYSSKKIIVLLKGEDKKALVEKISGLTSFDPKFPISFFIKHQDFSIFFTE